MKRIIFVVSLLILTFATGCEFQIGGRNFTFPPLPPGGVRATPTPAITYLTPSPSVPTAKPEVQPTDKPTPTSPIRLPTGTVAPTDLPTFTPTTTLPATVEPRRPTSTNTPTPTATATVTRTVRTPTPTRTVVVVTATLTGTVTSAPSPAGPAPAGCDVKVKIKAETLAIHSLPDTKSPVAGYLRKEAVAKAASRSSNGWIEIRMPDEKPGWVFNGKYVSVEGDVSCLALNNPAGVSASGPEFSSQPAVELSVETFGVMMISGFALVISSLMIGLLIFMMKKGK